MSKTFPDWDLEQKWLPPPLVLGLVPSAFPALFGLDAVRGFLNRGTTMTGCGEGHLCPPNHPTTDRLLRHAYCRAIYSLRRMAQGCVEQLGHTAVTGLSQADTRTFGDPRKRHLQAPSRRLAKPLKLSGQAGLAYAGMPRSTARCSKRAP
jgi:hypothetical protein